MLLFSYQCPCWIVSFLRTILFVICQFLADSLLIISHSLFNVKLFFNFFHFFKWLDFLLFCDNIDYFNILISVCQQLFYFSLLLFDIPCLPQQRVIIYHVLSFLSIYFFKFFKQLKQLCFYCSILDVKKWLRIVSLQAPPQSCNENYSIFPI